MRHRLAGIAVIWGLFGLSGLLTVAFQLVRYGGFRRWLRAEYPELAGIGGVTPR